MHRGQNFPKGQGQSDARASRERPCQITDKGPADLVQGQGLITRRVVSRSCSVTSRPMFRAWTSLRTATMYSASKSALMPSSDQAPVLIRYRPMAVTRARTFLISSSGMGWYMPSNEVRVRSTQRGA